MLFRDIAGQTELKNKLTATVKEGRIGHAQMFEGKAGYGNLALAIAYAQYMLCACKKDDDSCGECPACKKCNALAHPDLHFVFPVNSSKAGAKAYDKISDYFMKDWRKTISEKIYFTEQDWYDVIGIGTKQGNINACETDRIIAKLNVKPYESEYKIMIIWLPERMNETSGNRLLKLTEEPPANTFFIFVTETSDHVLKTIRSRTQRVKVPPVKESAIAESLRNKGMREKDIFTASRLSEGDYLKALEIAESRDNKSEYFEYFVDLMRAAYSDNIPELLNCAEELSSMGREKQKAFLTFSLHIIRESFMLNQKLEDLVYLGYEELEWARKFSPFINRNNISKLYDLINICIPQISRNANAKIVFTDLALRMKALIRPK